MRLAGCTVQVSPAGQAGLILRRTVIEKLPRFATVIVSVPLVVPESGRVMARLACAGVSWTFPTTIVKVVVEPRNVLPVPGIVVVSGRPTTETWYVPTGVAVVVPTVKLTTPVPAVEDSAVEVGLTVAVSPATPGTNVRTSTQARVAHVKPLLGFTATFRTAGDVAPATTLMVVVAPVAG